MEINQIIDDLKIGLINVYPKVSGSEVLCIYEGFISCNFSLSKIVHFKIETKEDIHIYLTKPDKREKIKFIFTYLIVQGQLDFVLKRLELLKYKDDILVYCGDLKELYLVSKLYLQKNKIPLYREIESFKYFLHRKFNLI